jgi:predicted enzyme related to lactoylglutathione lyase
MAAGLAVVGGLGVARDPSHGGPGLHEIMSVGWYVIFSRPSTMDSMTEFYGGTLGLPQMLNMRGPLQNKNLFWGGEDIVVDVSHHAPELPLNAREADPAEARQIPIFRTDDVAALCAGFEARGVPIIAPRTVPYGREAFIVDPMGRLIGFRERDRRSPLAADREARRRFVRGEAFNPGVAHMPAHLQEMGWIRLTVADPGAARGFYGDLLGLRFLGTLRGIDAYDLGDNTSLEVAAGGTVRPRPAEQRAAEAVVILRVVDFPAIRARLESAGHEFPYKIYDNPNGRFSYIADSEGNLLGLADRRPPDTYSGTLPVAVEDLEARRRWVEATRGGR